MIEFLELNNFFISLAALLFLLLIYFLFSYRRRRRFFKLLGESQNLVNLSKVRRFVRYLCLFFSFFFLSLVLARPYIGFKDLSSPQVSRDIILVLDLSHSMNVRDMRGLSRLEYAKWWIRKFIESMPSDRIGLLSFAGSTYKEVPLTLNKNYFLDKLDHLSTNLLPVGGTNIERALNDVLKIYREVNNDFLSIVLLTDGEQIKGDFKRALSDFKENKISISVVGLGDSHAGGIVLDEKGKVKKFKQKHMISKPNVNILKNIAFQTNGIYIPYDKNNISNDGLTAIRERISFLAGKLVESLAFSKPKEKVEPLLWASLIFMALFLVISEVKRK